MFSRRFRALAIVSASFTLFLGKASATTMTWSTYSTWSSNVTSPTELDFTSIDTRGVSYSTASGKTMIPVSGAAVPYVFTGPLTAGGYQLTGGQYTSRNLASLIGPSNGGGKILISLPSDGANAFLLGLGTIGSATSINIAFSDGQTFNIAAVANTTEFFGASISHKVSWIAVSASSQVLVDDFFFAGSKLTQDIAAPPAAPAIEGSTLILVFGGILSLFGARRRLFFKPAA